MASEEGHADLVRALIERGARADGDQGAAALAASVICGNHSTLAALIDAGADAARPDAFGVTPLMLAVERRATGVIRELISHGGVRPDVDALVGAVRSGHASIVRLLLDCVGDGDDMLIAASGPDETSPLEAAVRTRCFPQMGDDDATIVRALIAAGAGADVGRVCLRDGQGLLHLAVRKRRSGVVAALVGAGADVNAQNHAGRTPVMIGAKHGCLDCLAEIEAGAGVAAIDLSAADSRGRTALALADGAGQGDAVALLESWIAAGAKV